MFINKQERHEDYNKEDENKETIEIGKKKEENGTARENENNIQLGRPATANKSKADDAIQPMPEGAIIPVIELLYSRVRSIAPWSIMCALVLTWRILLTQYEQRGSYKYLKYTIGMGRKRTISEPFARRWMVHRYGTRCTRCAFVINGWSFHTNSITQNRLPSIPPPS